MDIYVLLRISIGFVKIAEDSYGVLWSIKFIWIPIAYSGLLVIAMGYQWIPMDYYGLQWIAEDCYGLSWITKEY